MCGVGTIRAQQTATDAALHLRIAQKAVEDNNFEIALDEVTIAATLAPTDAVIQFALATILDKRDKTDDALAAVEKAQTLGLPESLREKATDLRVTLLYKQKKRFAETQQAAADPSVSTTEARTRSLKPLEGTWVRRVSTGYLCADDRAFHEEAPRPAKVSALRLARVPIAPHSESTLAAARENQARRPPATGKRFYQDESMTLVLAGSELRGDWRSVGSCSQIAFHPDRPNQRILVPPRTIVKKVTITLVGGAIQGTWRCSDCGSDTLGQFSVNGGGEQGVMTWTSTSGGGGREEPWRRQ